MKKLLAILGVIFVCLVVAGAIVLPGLYYYAKGLDKEAKAHIDTIVPVIATSWSSKELINHASPEYLQDMPVEKIELLFNMLSSYLGPLEGYKGATGKIDFSISSEGTPIITGDYVAEAVFKNGPAKIHIRMIRGDDKWQIIGFLVTIKVKL